MKKTLIIGIVALILIIAVAGYFSLTPSAKQNPTIKQIINNPNLYEGKLVTLKNANYFQPPYTALPEDYTGDTTACSILEPTWSRQTSFIYDSTGCIASPEGLSDEMDAENPEERQISAIIEISSNGLPYLYFSENK